MGNMHQYSTENYYLVYYLLQVIIYEFFAYPLTLRKEKH